MSIQIFVADLHVLLWKVAVETCLATVCVIRRSFRPWPLGFAPPDDAGYRHVPHEREQPCEAECLIRHGGAIGDFTCSCADCKLKVTEYTKPENPQNPE